MEYAPAADTVLGSVLVAYDVGAGTTRTRRKMHIRSSKLALRTSLRKRIRRALVSVMDNHVESTVAAVRGVVAANIGVPMDGQYMWVFDEGLSQTLCRAPEEAQAEEAICLESKPATFEATLRTMSGCCSSEPGVLALLRRLSGRDLHGSLVFMSLCCKEAYAPVHDSPGQGATSKNVLCTIRYHLALHHCCARHPVMACSQLGSSVRLPTLLPTLVALLPTWHTQPCWCVHIGTCVCQCSAHMSLNQYVDPASL